MCSRNFFVVLVSSASAQILPTRCPPNTFSVTSASILRLHTHYFSYIFTLNQCLTFIVPPETKTSSLFSQIAATTLWTTWCLLQHISHICPDLGNVLKQVSIRASWGPNLEVQAASGRNSSSATLWNGAFLGGAPTRGAVGTACMVYRDAIALRSIV